MMDPDKLTLSYPERPPCSESPALTPEQSDLPLSDRCRATLRIERTARDQEALIAIARDPLRRLLTIPELAGHLGVTDRHIRQLISERRIPYVKWRRLIRLNRGSNEHGR